MSVRKGTRSVFHNSNHSDESYELDENGLSRMAAPGNLYKVNSTSARGRSDNRKGDESSSSLRSKSRGASRSRSRSTSVLRRIIGGSKKDKTKKSDDAASVASDRFSVASGGTVSKSKIKRIKKIQHNGVQQSFHSSFEGCFGVEVDLNKRLSSNGSTSPGSKKQKKKTKLKYKSRRVKDASGVDSDGDYGGADSDGDYGSVGGRSVSSEGVLSPRGRKVRRKKRPKKPTFDDDNTVGSSKGSLANSVDLKPASSSSLKIGKAAHRSKVAAIPEPPMSPAGAVIKGELDDLFPSPKSSSGDRKKLPKIKRKSKPEIAVISFDPNRMENGTMDPRRTKKGQDHEPIVDRTPVARPSDYRKAGTKEMDLEALGICSPSDGRRKGRPPLPNPDAPLGMTVLDYVGSDSVAGMDSETVSSWRIEQVGQWRKKHLKGESTTSSHQTQYHDSGLSIEINAVDIPTSNRSNRSNKSMRSHSKLSGDSDTVFSMTDTVSSLNKQLDEQKEQTMDLQKQLTEALSKVAALTEELRREESAAAKTNSKLTEITLHFDKIKEEKVTLFQRVDCLEEDVKTKEERIDKLQRVVETQLDTVELLEEKLEKTEDDLFKMEDELKALEDEGLLGQSNIVSNARGRLERNSSSQENVLSRKDSVRTHTQQSRSTLMSNANTINAQPSKQMDLDLEDRESKIKMREQKLDAWERELIKVDAQLKEGQENTEEQISAKTKLSLIEKRERRFEENREALEQEKEQWARKMRELENEIQMLKTSVNAEGGNEQEIQALKRSLNQMEGEKEAFLSNIAAHEKAKTAFENELNEFKIENQDILVKLDHVKATAKKERQENHHHIMSLKGEIDSLRKSGNGMSGIRLNDATSAIDSLQRELEEKNEAIKKLEQKLKNSDVVGAPEEEDGKDLLIRELQNQLVAAKKEAQELSSGDYVAKLKNEIKTLRQGYNELKKRMKKEETVLQEKLKEKIDTIQIMQKEMLNLKIDFERLEKRERNLGIGDGDTQKHIEDLEDEIDHWKAINASLENELEIMKTEANEHTKGLSDEGSLGSFGSLHSHLSEQQGMEMSTHSITSIKANDMFFVSDSNSMRSHRTIGAIPPPPPSDIEPTTPSQRALRSVSNLWSKMRTGPDPALQSNPSIPYAIGSLDDD